MRISWIRLAGVCALAACWSVIALMAQRDSPASLVTRSKQYDGTRLEFAVGGRRAFLILPDKHARDGSRPWIWYAPTFHGEDPAERHAWIFRRLVDRGFAIGGVDVGESWGNPDGRKVFSDFYSLVIQKHRLASKACLLPISRGGLMLYNWAAENADRVQCIGGIYPFVNLESYARGLRDIAKAYSMTVAEFQRNISRHNPIDNLGGLAERRVPILHLHGALDEVLPLEQNSGELGRRYAALGGRAEIVIVYGKGHEVAPEFWQSQTLVDFFISRGMGGLD